jgi:penicillin-binding protein-related factor A (putative recombinase)
MFVSNRRLGGFLAKKSGELFEAKIEGLCRYELITFVKIPPGCRSIGANRLVRVTTPFDCILGLGQQVVFLDLKSTREKKLSMTPSIVKPHQKEALSKLARHQKAGILVNFQAHDKLVFFDASKLYGKPLAPEDGKTIVNLRELFI